MALAGHHVGSSFTQHHRHASLQILRKTLGSGNLSQTDHMLDAIILLFSLDVSICSATSSDGARRC